MKKTITHTILKKKHVLLWCDKNETNDESLKFFLAFFIWQKFDTPNVNFLFPTKKRFL